MTATLDPSTGPIPRDEFAKLVDAPYGEATKHIRKYDPLYARAPGENIKWVVRVEQLGRREGTAEIEASSEKEAERKAQDLGGDEIEWDWDNDDFRIMSIKPATS